MQHLHVTKIIAGPFLAKYLSCYDLFAMLRALSQIIYKMANIVLWKICLLSTILSNIFAKLNGQSQTFEVKSVPPLYVLFAPWSKLHIFNFSKICTSITMPLSSRNTRSRPESNPKRFLQHVIDIINRNLLQFVSRDPE